MFPTLMGLFYALLIAAFVFILLFVAYLYMTTTAYPNLKRHDSEKFFFDSKSKSKRLFPEHADPAKIDLTVVVPAYNEEERLPIMMDEAMEYLEKRQSEDSSFSYEIIIVDDGSKDKTSEVGLRYSEKFGTEKVRVLTLQQNRGKGGAVRLGMLSGRGRNMLLVDADGASKFSDLDKLEQCLKSISSDLAKTPEKLKTQESWYVVCGSRAHLEKEAIAQRSFFRTFLMHGFHFIVWFFCVRGVRDTQCGFKLLSRKAAILLFSNLHVERWAFDVDLLFLAQYFKIPIGEVSINWQEIEGSKMVPVWSWLQMGRDIILIRLRYSLGIWKIKSKF